MKKMLLLLALLPGVAVAQPQVIVNPQQGCWEAVQGTVAHYAYGNGSNLPCGEEWEGGDIEGGIPPKGGVGCTLAGGIDSVGCWFIGENCPSIPLPPGDPHTFPDVAECTGCAQASGALPGKYSINQAKCCLKTGHPESILCP